MTKPQTAEHKRLLDHREKKANWKNWGPYLSERAWGTVREDYSANGDAWEHVTHDHARSRAYRWNEDGLAGISDRNQYTGQPRRGCEGVLLLHRFNPHPFVHEDALQISAAGLSICGSDRGKRAARL